MAMSCGNRAIYLKVVISLYLYLIDGFIEGSGITNTCFVDLFKAIKSPDYPWRTLSTPPNLALLKSEIDYIERTLLRTVLVLTYQTPKAVNKYSDSSFELEAIVGGEMLSSPTCSSLWTNLSNLYEITF